MVVAVAAAAHNFFYAARARGGHILAFVAAAAHDFFAPQEGGSAEFRVMSLACCHTTYHIRITNGGSCNG